MLGISYPHVFNRSIEMLVLLDPHASRDREEKQGFGPLSLEFALAVVTALLRVEWRFLTVV